jgi:hypothetical protein
VFVSHVLTTASATYGTVAAVIGLLSFIYLAVTAALVATEIVVAARGLWPRSVAPIERLPPSGTNVLLRGGSRLLLGTGQVWSLGSRSVLSRIRRRRFAAKQ